MFSLSDFPQPTRSGAIRRRTVAVFAGVLGLLVAAVPGLAAVNVMEYQLKAGFLFNFAKYIEWPPAALVPDSGLRLGVIAPDEVFTILEKSLNGKIVGNHPLIVERLTPTDLEKPGVTLPNIVFVHQDVTRARQENGLTTEQLAAIGANRPVLLVGESPNFASSGGMIGFVQRGENLRFQVNLPSAQRAGLKLSARLAGLAEMVTSSSP